MSRPPADFHAPPGTSLALTPDLRDLDVYRSEWRRIGHDATPADRPRAEAALSTMYQLVGESPPLFIWFDAPVAAADGLGGAKNADVPSGLTWLMKRRGLCEEGRPPGFGTRIAQTIASTLRHGALESLYPLFTNDVERALGDLVHTAMEWRPSVQPLALLEREMGIHGDLDIAHDETGTSHGWPEFRDGFWGQDLGAACVYTFLRAHLRLQFSDEASRLLDAFNDASKTCGEFWPYRGICVVADRPRAVRLDEQGRLHHGSLPALEYRDGTNYYARHGTVVPSEWVTAPESVDPVSAIFWSNTEERRAALEIFGWEPVLQKVGATSVDHDPEPGIGELLEANLPFGVGKARFLRLRCATGRQVVSSVPREMNTAREANAWQQRPFEAHETLGLPRGASEVRHQREWWPEGLRPVRY